MLYKPKQFSAWYADPSNHFLQKERECYEINRIDTCPLVLNASTAYGEELKKLCLDDASSIGTSIQTDTQVKTEGKGSIKITTQWPTTICLGKVTGLNVENAKLLYKAKVKSDLDGQPS